MQIRIFHFFLLALLAATAILPETGYAADGPSRLLRYDRGFLGIYSSDMHEDKAELLGFDNPYGSYVTRVIPGSGAAEAGLRPFDYVVGIDDQRVDRGTDLTDLLEAYEPGDEVVVHLIRDGEAIRLRATLGYRSSTGYTNIPEADQPFFGISPHDENEDDELGVRVEVIRNSTAEALGMQTGDLILRINEYPMVDWSDIGAAIDNMIPGRNIEVRFERNGVEKTVRGPIMSRRDTDRARETAPEQEPAFIGVYTESISEEKADKLGYDNPYGSFVTGIIPGTAAERAGLQPFDYIYGVDQYRVGEYQNLGHILRKFQAGDEATVHFYRRGRQETLPLTFGSREDRTEVSVSPCEDPFLGVRHSFSTNELDGVGISVIPNSTAATIGLQDGDIITHINDYPILDWSDIGTAVDLVKVGETIEVRYARNGNKLQGEASMKSECETRGESRDYDYDYDYQYDDAPWPERGRTTPRRDLPDNISMDMEDLRSQEAEAMAREHDIDMPTEQDLRIEGLNLFPNPSSGQFNLQFNLPNRGETSIRIFNASGRLIYNYELGAYSGEFNDEVDISQNGTGSYFLIVQQGSRSVSKKIILSRP